MYFRVVDGHIRRGDKVKFMANGVEREVRACLGKVFFFFFQSRLLFSSP